MSKTFGLGKNVLQAGTCEYKKEYLDLSTFTGFADVFDSTGTRVNSFALDLTFTDNATKNIKWNLTAAETTALAVGDYTVILRIVQTTRTSRHPSKGKIILTVKAADSL